MVPYVSIVELLLYVYGTRTSAGGDESRSATCYPLSVVQPRVVTEIFFVSR